MTKLVLIQPPVRDFYDTDIRLQPIGLCSLKAAVRNHLPEVEVVVRDFHQGYGRRTVALPEELQGLQSYYNVADRSPFGSFHRYFHFGADFATIGREVAALRPDIVGISSLFTPYFQEVLACAGAIREQCRATILAGGSHVSCAPETMLADPRIDFIIRGEGERPLVEFLRARMTGGDYRAVPNLGFRDGQGRAVLNPMAPNYPLEQLPEPDFSNLDPERYLFERQPICMVMTSRGCPHRCGFCSVGATFPRFRQRRPEQVVAEMEKRYSQGYRVFDFEDDNLTFDAATIAELCHLIIDRFRGKPIRLLAMNGVSYKSLGKETLTLMRRAGFTHLNLALVSSDPAVLAAVNRPHPVERFSQVVEISYNLGFRIVAYQILGLPRESMDSMLDTLTLLARYPLLIGVSIFYLTPGSPLAAKFPPRTRADMVRARSTAMAIETADCRRDDLYTLFVAARILNFLKGLPLVTAEINLNDLLNRPIEQGDRAETGRLLLQKLFEERTLYAATRQELKPLPHFQFGLFARLCTSLGYLSTLENKRIILDGL